MISVSKWENDKMIQKLTYKKVRDQIKYNPIILNRCYRYFIFLVVFLCFSNKVFEVMINVSKWENDKMI